MDAIPIDDTAGGAAGGGFRGTFADRLLRHQLRWRAAVLAALRVVLATLVLTLAVAILDLPVDSVPAAVEECFARHGQGDPDEFVARCLGGGVAAVLRAGWMTRKAVLSLLVAISVTAALTAAVRASYRKLFQDQLHFEEQLIDALPLPLSLRSADGLFLHVNKAFEIRHRVSRDELVGKPVAAFFGAEEAAAARMRERALLADEPVEQEFELTTPAGHSHVLARLGALRRVDGSLIGLLGVQTDITALRRKEAELVESNARLKQLSVQMLEAQEEERRRIARDLHDQVGQILTVLKLQLRGLAQRTSIDRPAASLASSIDLADEALVHTRDLSTSLHPHMLDHLGLEHALNWLVDRFIRPSVPMIDIVCRLDPTRGEPDVELVAFRVVQEALTNIVRHANATRAGVILEAARGQLSIEVLDDGVGFDRAELHVDLRHATSLGLTSMYERISECGGKMQIDSTRGVGTSLRVRLPWKACEA